MYKCEGMKKITAQQAKQYFNEDKLVYLLYNDNTEGLAEALKDILQHEVDGEEFGMEIKDFKNMINEVIDNDIENLLSTIYEENNIKSGDITPEQLLEWEKLTKQFSDLFVDLINQNTEDTCEE